MLAAAGLLLASCCCPEFCMDKHRGSDPSKASQSTRIEDDPYERPECRESEAVHATFPGQNPLPIILRCQEQMYSCWATSTEMVVEFLGGGRVRQCEQADHAFKRHNCCAGNGMLRPGACDLPYYPDFQQWGFDHDNIFGQPLLWGQITAEINAGQPFIFSWTPSSGSASGNPLAIQTTQPPDVSHMLVAAGYGINPASGVEVLIVLDPSPFLQTQVVMVPFADYNGTSGNYIHFEDYFNIRPQN